jgi:hypothetical protein
VADGGIAGPASGNTAAGFLEAPKKELHLMSAYSQSPSEYVLLCEAVKNGLNLDRYLSPVQDFTFFPENLDKNPSLNVHISSTKLNRIPGLGRFYIKLSLRGSDVLQLFASRDCRPGVQSRGMACTALGVAACLLRAWRDSHG